MTAPKAIRWACLLMAAASAFGCATRGAPVEEKELQAMLAFLHEPEMTRSVVEGRIGPPLTTFEGGRIAAYRPRQVAVPDRSAIAGERPQFNHQWRIQPSPEPTVRQHHLLIEYDANGKVVRHALLE